MDFRMGKPTFDNGTPRPCVVYGVRVRISVITKKVSSPEFIGVLKLTRGTETSQYLEERTSTETPLVVASERGPGQWRMCDNRNLSGKQGLRG